MTIEFERWPDDLARRYRERGYWIDRPLSHMLAQQVQRQPDATVLICGDRRFTYADLDRQSSNLAGHLSAAGVGKGDTALVQLPNIAEFYLVFFALIKIGAAPINALFSHRRLEMTSYAEQIAPKLVIASRSHELFADDAFLEELKTASPRLAVTLLLGERISGAASNGCWQHLPKTRRLTPLRQQTRWRCFSFPAAAPAHRN